MVMMIKFKEYLEEATAAELKTIIELCREIEKNVRGIKVTKIEHAQTTSNRITVDHLMNHAQRPKYATEAKKYISNTRNVFSSGDIKIPLARATKSFSFAHPRLGDVPVLVRLRPDGKAGASGRDPNELMAAVLCCMENIKTPDSVEEMDDLIAEVKAVLQRTKKVTGYSKAQESSIDSDYDNLIKAISAAIAIHAHGWGGAEKAYLTGQAWSDDVKGFQITRYGMKDFNSSDFILKKGNRFLGVSLKKKSRINEADPTLINKSFNSLLDSKEFDRVRDKMLNKTSEFYIRILKNESNFERFPKAIQEALSKEKPTKDNWKKFINGIPKDIVNSELRSSGSIFREVANIVDDHSELFANQLLELIFKTSLKELQKMNFDFTLVTGIGDYLPARQTIRVQPASYVDITTMTTAINDLVKSGEPRIELRTDVKQAFEEGATAAGLFFVLRIGNTPICNINLRYKGSYSSAPNFLAEMTKEFKDLIKTKK
jgi:hypothetical protein